MNPNVYIGRVSTTETFDASESNDIDDDEVMEETPDDVVTMLGFDPLEDEDESVKPKGKVTVLPDGSAFFTATVGTVRKSYDLLKAAHKLQGRGDSKYDQAELKLGIKVEMEHTTDQEVAVEIAKDHLAEFPKYYSKVLLPAEKEAKDEEKPKKKCSKEDAVRFLKKHPNPTDRQLHDWADRRGFDTHMFEQHVYELATGYVEKLKSKLFIQLDKAAHKLQGRYEFQGLPISVENRRGSTRKWYDPLKDESGETKMKYDYGYIRATKGNDGDSIDCYIGPTKMSKRVFIVHQNDPKTGKYDEDKVMLGFSSKSEAKDAYLMHYDDPKFFGSIEEMPFGDFQEKVTRKRKGKVVAIRKVTA